MKDAYINGIDSIEEYRENKKILSSKREDIQKKLDNTKVAAQPVPIQKEINFEKMIDLIHDENTDYITKGNALRDVFDHFVWNKEKGEMCAVLNIHVKPLK